MLHFRLTSVQFLKNMFLATYKYADATALAPLIECFSERLFHSDLQRNKITVIHEHDIQQISKLCILYSAKTEVLYVG